LGEFASQGKFCMPVSFFDTFLNHCLTQPCDELRGPIQ
ncbi:MAG: hypothetical protein ACI89F_000939, partial [Porticoccaceae bacterium]